MRSVYAEKNFCKFQNFNRLLQGLGQTTFFLGLDANESKKERRFYVKNIY